MSQENIGTVSRLFEEWATGDLRAGAEHYDEHVVFVVRPNFAEFGVFLGAEGIREYMRRFLENWERTTFEAEHIEVVGDTVVARLLQRGTGRASGAEAELRFFILFTFRGRKIVRQEAVLGEREALEAVGLAE